MALERTEISSRHFLHTVRPLLGLPVSRIWLGYGQALFLELGRLHIEYLPRIKLPSGMTIKRRTTTHGQATVMLDTRWTLRGPRSQRLSRKSPSSEIKKGIALFRGHRVRGIDIQGRPSKLIVDLGGPFEVSARQRNGAGVWAIELYDRRLFPRAKKWLRLDHAMWFGVDERGGLVRDMCYGGPDH